LGAGHPVSAGCGFIGYQRSTIVLPTSELQVVAPDCVILRKDGGNSAGGVRPDVPIDKLYAESLALFAGRIVKAASATAMLEDRSSG
jgi:hypothetical protein